MAVVQSAMDVNQAPTILSGNSVGSPATWTYIWVGLAVLVIVGFHIRVFGYALPPVARFP